MLPDGSRQEVQRERKEKGGALSRSLGLFLADPARKTKSPLLEAKAVVEKGQTAQHKPRPPTRGFPSGASRHAAHLAGMSRIARWRSVSRGYYIRHNTDAIIRQPIPRTNVLSQYRPHNPVTIPTNTKILSKPRAPPPEPATNLDPASYLTGTLSLGPLAPWYALGLLGREQAGMSCILAVRTTVAVCSWVIVQAGRVTFWAVVGDDHAITRFGSRTIE